MPSFLPRRRFGLGLTGLLLAATVLPLSGCAGPAAAQRGMVLVPDFADLAERVLPAVVNIAVTSEQVAPILRRMSTKGTSVRSPGV